MLLPLPEVQCSLTTCWQAEDVVLAMQSSWSHGVAESDPLKGQYFLTTATTTTGTNRRHPSSDGLDSQNMLTASWHDGLVVDA